MPRTGKKSIVYVSSCACLSGCSNIVDINDSDQAFPNETVNYTSYGNGSELSKTIQITLFTLIMVLSLIGNLLIVAAF